MPIFRRDPEEPSPAGRPASSGSAGGARRGAATAPARTEIARGTRLTGRIEGSTEVAVFGELVGEVRLAARLLIGEGGRVEGSVEARSVEIAGRAEGDVRAREKVAIASSGVVEGDVVAPRVAISEGAFLKGRVEMGGDGGDAAGGRTAAPSASSGGAGRGAARDGAARDGAAPDEAARDEAAGDEAAREGGADGRAEKGGAR